MDEKKLSNEISDYAQEALDLAKRLFLINRSINSPGTVKTLKELQINTPQLEIKSFGFSDCSLDWDSPRRWHIKKASIKRLNGEIVVDFAVNNLHVVSHSVPVKSTIKLVDLKEKIHTLSDKPDAIPYRTSFYTEDWGFCMEHSKYLSMHDDEYQVEIDSFFTNDPMPYGEILIPGSNGQKEILFSTYICHPSMANNELSGPVVAMALIRFLLSLSEKPFYSYRFLFMPETIGAISYINSNLEAMKDRIISGLVLTCVGDERCFSIVKNKNNKNFLEKIVIDKCIELKSKYSSPLKIYDFALRQSDERQYCSPGVDLPISCFCRSKYGSYPEYHTSDDNFDVVTEKGLEGAIDVLVNSILAIEKTIFPKYRFICEPNLGKRGLYPLMGAKKIDSQVRNIKNFLTYADGLTALEEIAVLLNLDMEEATNLYERLLEKGVVN
jgi:aminopeptidase-like protein